MHRRKRRGEERGFQTSNLKSRGEERSREDGRRMHRRKRRGEERGLKTSNLKSRGEERRGEEQIGWKTNA